MASFCKARATVVSVASTGPGPDSRAEAELVVQRVVDHMRGEGIDAEGIVLEGRPDEMIVAVAKERDARETGEALDQRTHELEKANLRLNLQTRELTLSRRAADAANAAKSEFLANMSHEIRTPLTIILGLAEELQDTELTEEERADLVGTVLQNGSYLLEIINDILDLSKIEAGKLEVNVTSACRRRSSRMSRR